MTQTPRILIADDEPANIEALVEYLQSCGIDHDYASDMDEAAEIIQEAQENQTPYTAVICDNHFNQCLAEYGSNFDGVDLVNILQGNEQNFGAGHERFIEAHFPKYEEIKSNYEGRVIMFSGSAVGDSLSNPTLYEGITIVNKYQTEEGSCCEAEIINILHNEFGIAFKKSVDQIKAYKQDHGLEQGIGLESSLSHEEAVRKLLEESGEDLSLYELDDSEVFYDDLLQGQVSKNPAYA